MDARTLQRLGFCVLIAALAGGCSPLRPRPLFPLASSGTSTPYVVPNTVETTNPDIPSGTVIAAGGPGAVQSPAAQPAPPVPAPPAPAPVVQIQQPPAPPGPIAMPRPLPPAPGSWPNGTDPQMMPPATPPGTLGSAPGTPGAPGVASVPGTLPGAPPGTQPGAPPSGVAHGTPYVTKPGRPQADPHIRNTPTATGGRLGLAPYEVPTDRVVELTLHLERLLIQNQALVTRIKELENAGSGHQEALTEAQRAIEAVNADAAKTRQLLQAQVLALQDKIKEMDKDDIEFLKQVIKLLGQIGPKEKP